MIKYLLTVLLICTSVIAYTQEPKEPFTDNNYVCTVEQLEKASIEFMKCHGKNVFRECYAKKIKEYCSKKLFKGE